MDEARHVSRLGPGRPGELELVYRLEERIPLAVAASHRHVERWAISVLLDRHESDEGRVEIGYAHVLVFNLESGVDIGDLVDRASGTWVDIQVDGPEEDAPGSVDRRPDDHVLLLDRVWLERDHRGRGLGPIVAAAVIERLGRGCRLAACYPAPFEDTSQQPEDRGRAIEALGAIWAKVGFRPWRDGVWMLDLSETDMHATLAELLAARLRGVPGS